MTQTIGKRIAELRRAKNLTQEDLAEKFGLSAQAVSKWENDQSCPDITLLPDLADLLGVSVDALLRGETLPETRYVEEEARKPMKDMIFRIVVDSTDGDRVRVNLPMELVRVALQIGVQVGTKESSEILQKIDIDQVMKLVDVGAIGKLVEVDSHEGDHVEMWVE